MGTLAFMRRGTTRKIVALLSALILGLAMLALDGSRNSANAQAAPPPIEPNPDLAATCGIDLVVLVDASGSIASANAEDEVIAGFNALLGGLADTGSRAGVIEFATAASVELGYTNITTASLESGGAFFNYAAGYSATGLTNWEQAFQLADSSFTPNPELVVIITDGDPTISSSGVNLFPDNIYDAIVAANVLKTTPTPNNATGSHILAIGVSGPTLGNLQAISGPDTVPPMAVNQSTVPGIDVITTSFADLEDALALLSETLCSEITLTKTGTLDMTVTGDTGVAEPGDVINYTLDVENTGNTVLDTVAVSDALLADETCPALNTVGNNDDFLDPGEVLPCTGSYTLTQPDIDAGKVDNTATATAVAPLGTQLQDDDDESVPIEQVYDLSVAKSNASLTTDADSSGDITLGDTVTFTITATNTGNATLHNVVVSDPSLTPTGGTTPCASVAPGATCTLVGTYVVTLADANAGFFDNTGTADSDETDPVTDDVRTPVNQDPELSVAKSDASLTTDADSSGDITAGDTVTFTITATNTGNVTLSNVVVSDPLLTPTGGTTPCASVAPGGTCTLIGTYVVTLADSNAGYFDNTGTADSDETEPVDDTVRTPVNQDAELSVAKSAASLTTDADSSGDITVGDTVTFTITATNTGNVTLSNVVVSDASLTPTGGTTPCASVAPGGTCTLEGTYVVTQADADTGYFDNTGCADSDETSQVCDDERTTVEQDPEITIVKGNQGDPGNDFQVVDAGQAATWTIVVTNTGNVTLTNVVVTDVLAPDCDRDSNDIAGLASMAPGDEVTYDCTLLDVQNFLDNIAQAEGLDPTQEEVSDDDNSPITFISANAAIGDTVWLDEDGDGIEDPDEEGVPNADVDLYECLDPQCNTTVFVATTTTNADGIYGFFFLEVGDYLVVVDTDSVDGDLTTPGSFVVPLGSQQDFLNADFGVEEVLPVTGIDSDRIGWMGLVLLSLGGMLILGSGVRRRKEN